MAKVWMDFDAWAGMNDSWDGKSVEELNRRMTADREREAKASQFTGNQVKTFKRKKTKVVAGKT